VLRNSELIETATCRHCHLGIYRYTDASAAPRKAWYHDATSVATCAPTTIAEPARESKETP
jgi:hypothetical protein